MIDASGNGKGTSFPVIVLAEPFAAAQHVSPPSSPSHWESGFLAWRRSYCWPKNAKARSMKTILGLALIVVIVAAIFTALGLADKNHMLGFGLCLAVLSSLVTIALAVTAKIQAVRSIFVPTPAVVEHNSAFFSNITAIQNYRTEEHRELASLRQDLRALSDKHDSAALQISLLKTHMRLCFDNIRYHEEITLPYALAGQVGTVLIATILTLVGTALCAFPDCAYMLAKTVNALLVTGFQHVGNWLAG